MGSILRIRVLCEEQEVVSHVWPSAEDTRCMERGGTRGGLDAASFHTLMPSPSHNGDVFSAAQLTDGERNVLYQSFLELQSMRSSLSYADELRQSEDSPCRNVRYRNLNLERQQMMLAH